MANDYDRIFKENIEELLPFLLRKILNLEVKSWENISTEIPLTLERKPDFLKKVYPTNQATPYLLHLEFQTVLDPEMPFRMLEYFGILFRKHKIPIRQVVIQLGKIVEERSEITLENLTFSYESIFLQSYDYEEFIDAQSPEEVLLAVLANFKGTPPKKVLKKIVERLFNMQSARLSKRFEQKYANQLFVLSRIRNLDNETFKLLETMPFDYNIEKDYLYNKGIQEGLEKGLEKGIERGIERGIEKGIEKEKLTFAQTLLTQTDFSEEKIAVLVGLSLAEIQRIKQAI